VSIKARSSSRCPTRRLGLVLATMALLAAGCMKTRPEIVEADEALATLNAALEAWQSGATPATLREERSIIVTDPAWAKGAKLIKFEIEEDHTKQSGYDLVISAKLWLDDGRKSPQKAKFTVSTTPAQVVIRNFGA
jgi:hypothetical protein